MSNYRWLLMDADNTLFDFNAAQEFSLTRMLIHFGVEPTAPVKDSFKTINAALWNDYDRGEIAQADLPPERFRRFFAAQGIDGDVDAWCAFYREALAGCSTLLPGAEQTCHRLADHYTLALCTNGTSYIQRHRLEASPLARYFGDRIFISEEMGCHKPDKLFFETVVEQLGARTRRYQCLVIGDSLSSDIRGAFNARLDSVWIRPHGAKAGALKPTYETSNLADLVRLLGADRLLPLSYDDLFR